MLTALVCILVTTSFHGHVAEVDVGPREGLDRDSAVSCDNIFTLPKTVLTRRRGRLGPDKIREFDRALTVALGLA
jgi:mRNA interferase MazF